ncbi:MAG: hypothetical protein IBJ11_00395 [Phycisphaerales bacterium]|nr:hypothetical protein [Phycisphaerales bacterium]
MSTKIVRAARVAAALSPVIVAGAVSAQPTNTTLPNGWSWQSIPGGTYDTGFVQTGTGGFNGQTTGPFTDTSYGILNEPNTPWFTGTDLSTQQYVQRQLFGNYGTGSPPGPSGYRFFNFGYTGPNGPFINGPISTANGSNFPYTAAERRSVSLTQWNNPNRDLGGVATLNQVVYVPISATLSITQGFGADEMLIKVIGGTSGQRSEIRVDVNVNARFSTTGFGGITGDTYRINMNGISQQNDAGPGNNYDVPFGFNVAAGPGGQQIFRDNSSGLNSVFKNTTVVAAAGPGSVTNSVGYSANDTFNVLSSISQTGGSTSIVFNSSAEMYISRNFGQADARGSMGPGMQGTARLVVQWAAFRAIPAPGAAVLFGLAGLMAARRRRA